MAYTTERMFSVPVTVAGTQIAGVFDEFDGGDVKVEGAEVYFPGGMADGVAVAGTASTEPITLMRGYDGDRDLLLEKWLYGQLNAEVLIGKSVLRGNKSVVGVIVFRGILVGVGTPKVNSNGTAVTKLAITVLPSGLPS